jgi:hypothetical protein
MVDVHVTIQSKTSEKHVFKDQEPRKNKTKVEEVYVRHSYTPST